MRVYTSEQEEAIRARQRADQWLRSGLIDAAQRARMAESLQVDLRRTNRFLRLTLFAFGVLIVGAATGLVAVTLRLDGARTIKALCLAAALVCVAVTEFLIGRFRLYHFGVEEACAVASVVLAAIGCGLLVGSPAGNGQILAALITGSALSCGVYLRYGYVYAAAGAMACLGLAPFQASLSEVMARGLAAALLGGCLIAARMARRRHGDGVHGDDCESIEALAWLGLYAALNLQIVPAFSSSVFSPTPAARWFSWTTYAMIWILPSAGLWLSIRGKQRALLDASLVMALGTLITNKPYLGAMRKPWDPILLGALLIGAALAVRRWLANGADRSRHGFTASRVLRSARDALTAAGLASAAFHPAHDQPHADAPPPDLFEGGRSGGGGGGAAY